MSCLFHGERRRVDVRLEDNKRTNGDMQLDTTNTHTRVRSCNHGHEGYSSLIEGSQKRKSDHSILLSDDICTRAHVHRTAQS